MNYIKSIKTFLFLFIIILFLVVLNSCRNRTEKILPQKRNLTESVYSSVIIQPDSLYKVYAAVGGILDRNLVEEGDLVSKNNPLIQMINNTPKLNTQNARLALNLAKENYNGSAAILRGIEEEISAARLKFQNDSINYFRQKNLWDQNIGSKAEFDNKKLNYRLSANNLQLLQSRYHRTKNELLTALKQAENNYKTSLITTKDFTVKSAIDGKVYALYKNPGEIISTLEPLAAIGSSTVFIIEMLVDEIDIVSILTNQPILITLDAYPGEVYSGKVSKIYPQKDQRNQTFKVEALFDKAPAVLYPGLSGEANIIISKKENVLTIPKEYLIGENKVKTEDGIVSISIGLQSMEHVEVLSGIGDETYIFKPK
ncbi:MAG: efflux RND transporter periplasmic adaptor subunit [Bacteroidia bacterium]|nr:efflux RND transporter periplasmic adaptor subunit [Bacteroidia bacterium]